MKGCLQLATLSAGAKHTAYSSKLPLRHCCHYWLYMMHAKQATFPGYREVLWRQITDQMKRKERYGRQGWFSNPRHVPSEHMPMFQGMLPATTA